MKYSKNGFTATGIPRFALLGEEDLSLRTVWEFSISKIYKEIYGMSVYESTLLERKQYKYKPEKYHQRLELCRDILLRAKSLEFNPNPIILEDITLEDDPLPKRLYEAHALTRERDRLERERRWALKNSQVKPVKFCPFKALQELLKTYGGRYAMEALRQELARRAKLILEAIRQARAAKAPAITNS